MTISFKLQSLTQPNYKSSKLESLIFEGEFIPAKPKTGDSITVSVFSDDGVAVEVDGKLIFDRFGKGQHLPNLKESLHDLPGPDKGKWIPGKRYFIRIKYSNIIFTGDADIDGLTVFGHNGGGAVPTVDFENTSRGGDRVVSAKDEQKKMPGGKKELKVRIKNSKDKATLKIVGKDKTSGSASFDEKANKTELKDVADGDTIVLHGRNISSAPRDVEIQAFLRGKLAGQFSLTVFRVDQESFVKGDMSKINGFVKATSHIDSTLLDLAKGFTANNLQLGVNKIFKDGEESVYAGIVLRGKIIPTGMDKMDFFRDHNRFESFNWDRRGSVRRYNAQGCLRVIGEGGLTSQIRFIATDDFTDNDADLDKDLTPDPDDPTQLKDLFIWTVDGPNLVLEDIGGGVGSTASLRWQFHQRVYYATVPVSDTLPWFVRMSIENTGKGTLKLTGALVKNKNLQDNQVMQGTTPLSQDLNDSNIKFTIKSVTPTDIKRPLAREAVTGNITGVNLDAGKECQHIVYMVREFEKKDETRFTIIEMSPRTSITKTNIKGDYQVFPSATLAEDYKVKVFIFDKAVTAKENVNIHK